MSIVLFATCPALFFSIWMVILGVDITTRSPGTNVS
jgi:hypothetical protein